MDVIVVALYLCCGPLVVAESGFAVCVLRGGQRRPDLVEWSTSLLYHVSRYHIQCCGRSLTGGAGCRPYMIRTVSMLETRLNQPYKVDGSQLDVYRWNLGYPCC